MGSQRSRRRIAVATCFLWLLAVELLPNAHQLHHRADHSHGAGGLTVHHGDHAHAIRPAQAEAPAKPKTRQLAIHGPLDYGPRHDAAGIAHRAIALLDPPPPPHAPAPIVRVAWQLVAECTARPAVHPPGRPTARGPPAGA